MSVDNDKKKTGTDAVEGDVGENTSHMTTKQQLDRQPKVRCVLSRPTGSTMAGEYFSINDYSLYIKYGEPVEIPVSIYEIIEERAKAEEESRKYVERMKLEAQKNTVMAGGGIY